MSNVLTELKERFLSSLPEQLSEPERQLEEILGQLLLHEMAANESLYDQRRYDYVFEGVSTVFGWSRVELHQGILTAKEMHRSFPEPAKTYRDVLTDDSKQILLEIVDLGILAKCEDEEFKTYLREKLAAQLASK